MSPESGLSDMPGGFSEEDRAALLAQIDRRYDMLILALREALPTEVARAEFDSLSRAQQEAQVDKALDILAKDAQEEIDMKVRTAQLLDAFRSGRWP